jgi:SAM-dependent methyltransferase
MLDSLKKEISDTLTREKIRLAVEEFSKKYCSPEDVMYDIGGVSRYSYKEYFPLYYTINKSKEEHPDIIANAEKLPRLKTGNVICIALLEHVENPEKVIREIRKVVRDKGYVYIWVPFFWREHNYPVDNYRFTKQGLENMLKKCNMEIVESCTDSYNGLFFVISHIIRFMIKDPHNCRLYDPLIYAYWLASKLSALDKILHIRYSNIYVGTDIVARAHIKDKITNKNKKSNY